MTDNRRDDYEALRLETSRMLNLDPANLSPTEALRLDLAALLRLSLDSLQGQALSGREVDLSRLQSCYGMLAKLLPQAVEAPPQVHESSAARRKLAELISNIVETIGEDEDDEIARLNQVIAEKDSVITTLGGSLAPSATSPVDAAPTPSAAPTQSPQPPLPPPSSAPPAHYLRGPVARVRGGTQL